jgi:hypothetical protein
VYQPFLLRRLGATQDLAGLKPYCMHSLRLIAYASPVAIAALFFLADPLVALLLPAYREALPATKLYCLASFWCLLPPVTFVICVAAKRTGLWLAQTLLILAAHTMVTSLVLRADGGLLGASVCRGLAYAAYTVVQVHLAMSLLGARKHEWLALTGSLIVPFLTVVIICLGIDVYWPLPADSFGLAATSLGRLSVACALLGLQYLLADRCWAFSRVLTAPTGVAGDIGGTMSEETEEEKAP